MIQIPFFKLHGAENDFLLTWSDQLPHALDLPATARLICSRYTGIGADGWMIVSPAIGGLETRLFNSDGSEPEISGNGTRCAAALALWSGTVKGDQVIITTAAGEKQLTVLAWDDICFRFEMDMGIPSYRDDEIRTPLTLLDRTFDATLVNVGNPQCALFIDDVPEDWRSYAAAAEAHDRFPRRSNVSLVRVIDKHNIDVLFYERGAGETRSSGTGSTGAATAAILRKVAESPVMIHTPAGELTLRWDNSVHLTGPAEFIGEGLFALAE